MTLTEAIDAVEYLKTIAGDYELAHSFEDEFREKVLRAIAFGAGPADAPRLAAIALSTSDIKFARHCA